jgi:hypothetical protein
MREIGTIGENGKSFLHFSYTLTFNPALTRDSHSARLCLLSRLSLFFPRRSERIRIVFSLAMANDDFSKRQLTAHLSGSTPAVEDRRVTAVKGPAFDGFTTT